MKKKELILEVLKNFSVNQIKELSDDLKKIADDLKKQTPTYALALAAGVRDTSYNTVANGYVSSYTGKAIVIMDDCTKWECIGYGPKGDAWSIWKQGYIDFKKIVEE